jgi:NitT/TauT family transport system substrate-binding protein
MMAVLGGMVFHWIRPHPPVRIGICAYSGCEYLIVAKEKGFFEKAKLNVELVEFGSLSDVQRAFEWGQIHGMVAQLADVVLMRNKCKILDPRIILIPSFPLPEGETLLVATSRCASVADLKGKRIGVEIRSWGHFFLLKALKTRFLNLNDVTLVPADPTASFSLLQKGMVDAAVVYPPHSSWLLEDKTLSMKVIFSGRSLPKEATLNVLAISRKKIKRYWREWAKLVELWDELLDFKQLRPQAAIEAVARHEMTSMGSANRMLESFKPLRLEEQMPLLRSNRLINRVLAEIGEGFKVQGGDEETMWNAIFEDQLVRNALLKKGR